MVQKFVGRICSFKNIGAKLYASDYYDVNVNKYGVKCDTSLRFLGKKRLD